LDAIEKKLKNDQNKNKRERLRKFHNLRKLRKARDIASRHLTKRYTTNFLIRNIGNTNVNEFSEKQTTNALSVTIYSWAKKYMED